jgi:hypothetical protein
MSQSILAGTFFIPRTRHPTFVVNQLAAKACHPAVATLSSNVVPGWKACRYTDKLGDAAENFDSSWPRGHSKKRRGSNFLRIQMRQLSAVDRRKECPNVDALFSHAAAT